MSDNITPLESLLGKSRKAVKKLPAGTWQHTMLTRNIEALETALSLQGEEDAEFTHERLDAALEALSNMVGRTETFLSKSPTGTSQHSLLTGRLNALKNAERVIRERRNRPGGMVGI